MRMIVWIKWDDMKYMSRYNQCSKDMIQFQMRYRWIQKATKSFDELSKDVIGVEEKRDDKMVECMIIPIYKEIFEYI